MWTKRQFMSSVPLLCLFACLFPVASGASCPSWGGAPVPVAGLNTGCHDKAPFLSFDGLTLYFSRDISPGTHYSRIYRARRSSVSEPFGPATEISSLNYAAGHVSGPWVSPDNLRMYYYVTGGPGKRLKVAERGSVDDEWIQRLDIYELNTLGDLTSPTLTRNERIIIFSGHNLPGGHGQWDLWMAQRADRDAPFGNVMNLGAVNTDAFDVHPSITPEGLTLYFTSNRSGVSQIFRARCKSLDAPFGMVEHLSVLDTPGAASEFPFLALDGRTMYFGRWPAGQDMDIYTACIPCTYYADVLLGANDQDGLSPLTAFATIQRAIDAAVDGDTISVLPGVYRESIRFAGKAVTVRSDWDAAILETPEEWAVSFQQGEGPDSVLRNLIIRNSLVGIWLLDSSPTITNVTVVRNEFGIDASGDARPNISNCISCDNAVSDLYGCRAAYSCIGRGADNEGSFSCDPLFVDADNGDYHVRSSRGRYWPEHDVWVLDDVSSPCIDAGDPSADFSAEREPNGGRVNIGAHGGTAFAAMSEASPSITAHE